MPRKKKPECEIIDLSKGEKSLTYTFSILVPESKGQIARQLATEKVLPPLTKYLADAVQEFQEAGARKYAEAMNYLKQQTKTGKEPRSKKDPNHEPLLEDVF
jgi:hypothetical protein